MTLEIDLAQQVVAVTGGTGGIGRGIVDAMVRADAKVAFCAPDQAECDTVANEIRAMSPGAEVLGLAADLTDRASLTAFVEHVVRAWGPVDTLVCNAADFGRQTVVDDVDLDVFVPLLEHNVVNNFHLCRLVLPSMVERSAGSIILITSITGYTTMPTNIPYSSSKAAIASMGRSLAAQYASNGIRVNCVSPGLIKTAASRDLWEDEGAVRAYVQEKVPMQSMGLPRDLGGICVFLASPWSSYITAATIPVDGGRLGIGMPAGSPLPAKGAE